MNTAILFDRELAEAKASDHNTSLRVLPTDDRPDSAPMYEIRLSFDGPIVGRCDVTYLQEDGRHWTVDPYIEQDGSLTAGQARSMAKTLEAAALLVDELNGTEAA
jgi:hypothetical protein